MIRCIFTAAMAIGLGPVALAVPVSILNPSFENPGTGNGTFAGGMTTGPNNWTVSNTGPTNTDRFFGVWNPTGTLSYDLPIPAGTQIGVVFLDDVLGLEAGLRQTLTSTLQTSTQYTLDVDVGNFRFTPGDPWDFNGFPGYRVDLMAGSTVLASDNNSLSPGEGVFLTSTVSFTTGSTHPDAGQPLAIRLVNLNGAGVEVNFDNVRLDAVAVPEPAGGMILVSAACSGLLLYRRTVRNSGRATEAAALGDIQS